MMRLKLRLLNKDSWSQYVDPSTPSTVFCPTTSPPEVGAPVQLEVLFQKGARLLLRGMVLWRRPFGEARARPGCGVSIETTERSKLDYIRGYVRGGLIDKRAKRRLPIRLRVTYMTIAGRRVNFTRDITEEGISLWCNQMLEKGTKTRLRLASPEAEGKPIDLQGVVTHLFEEKPRMGMGLRLTFEDERTRKRFAEFVSQLEQQLVRGRLPDEALM